jgi:LysR family transcriptional regulator, benzoate and cis,cis-muconate-responsive activator of ben and cat genes
MEFRHLRYFVAVARERSFTRAAERLNIAQPPLSRQIRQLEQELAVELFERGSRPLSLTAAGRFLFEQAIQLLARMEELSRTTRRFGTAGRRQFLVGFVGSTLYGGLPGIVRGFRAANPGLALELVEMNTLEQLAALKEGRIDVGFGRLRFDDPAVAREVLVEERLAVALFPDHALAGTDAAPKLARLAQESLIIYPKSPRPSYADQVLSFFRDQGLEPATVLEVRELQTALGLVAAGVGICVVPGSVQRLHRDNVLYRPLDEPQATSPVIMSFRKDDGSPEIRQMRQLIHEAFRAGQEA